MLIEVEVKNSSVFFLYANQEKCTVLLDYLLALVYWCGRNPHRIWHTTGSNLYYLVLKMKTDELDIVLHSLNIHSYFFYFRKSASNVRQEVEFQESLCATLVLLCMCVIILTSSTMSRIIALEWIEHAQETDVVFCEVLLEEVRSIYGTEHNYTLH